MRLGDFCRDFPCVLQNFPACRFDELVQASLQSCIVIGICRGDRRIAHEDRQRCLLENIYDDGRLSILIVEGNLPLVGFAKMLEFLDTVEIALRGQCGHLRHVTTYQREGFFR